MPEENSRAERTSVRAQARTLSRTALKASLATLDAESGSPYASLITIAAEANGTPVFLISTLAKHTQNLMRDSRASILFDGTDGLGDPLEGGRLTVSGRVEISSDKAIRARFLSRHPEAALYADFKDFSFYRLILERGHYVGGFGSIYDLEPHELIIDTGGADALLEAEEEIVIHMNEDHAGAIELYATKLLGGAAGRWRMSGCDTEGCDLVLGEKGLRLVFSQRVLTPGEIRVQLAMLAETARS